MYFLCLVLNKEENLNEVLEKFNEIGIKGATVLDSKGMGQNMLECGNPVVGGLRALIFQEHCQTSNKTIFSVVENEEKVDIAINEIENIIGELDDEGTGILFSMPLSKVKGLEKSYKHDLLKT